MLPCFTYSIIDLADDRRVDEPARAPAGVMRNIPHVQSGVRTVADMEASFARGAAGGAGLADRRRLIDTAARERQAARRPTCR